MCFNLIAFCVLLCYHIAMIHISNDIIFQYFDDNFSKYGKFLQNTSDFYEIIYVLSGDVFLSCDNKIFKLTRRTMVILTPNCKRKFYTDNDKKVKLFHIAFDKKFFNENHNINSLVLRPFHQQSSSLHYFFLAIQTLERRNLSSEVFISYLYNFIPLILLEISNVETKVLPSSPSSSLVIDVANYINAKYTSNLSVESIAKAFFVSRTYLTHEFKKHFNVSIKQYITRKKMLYARKLIKAGVKPTKVAVTCGYENYSTFFRQYKNYFGQTPESYDKN